MNFPEILFEDDWIFALAKPALIHSVGEGRSLASLIAQMWPRVVGIGRKPEDNGLLQRLDFETSGVILGAKNQGTFEKLRERMDSGASEKRYRLVVEGLMTGAFTVESQLGNRHRGSKRVTVYPKIPLVPRALPAETEFSVIHLLNEERLAVLEARATNARRHQVRAHAAYRGLPLLGDTLYGAQRTVREILGSDSAPTFLLHALSVKLKHPETGEPLEIKAPLPGYWKPFEEPPGASECFHHEDQEVKRQ